MAAKGGVPIVESARAGFDFMRNSFRTIAPAGLLTAAVAALAAAASPGEPAEAMNLPALALDIASLALNIAFSAFLLRLAVRQDASGLYGLKAGKDESNLLGALLWVGFFIVIVILVALFIFSIGLVIAAGNAGVRLEEYQNDPDGMRDAVIQIMTSAPWLWVLGLLEFAVLVWLSTRLTLVSVATIGEGRIMGFSTWPWTKGNVLRIFAATILIALPLSFAFGLIVGVISGVLGVTDQAGASPMARGVLSFISGVGQYLVLLPAINGLLAYLYRGLRPPELPVK